MANKPVDMSKLKQVLRLYKNGDMSNRKIAETVELDKNTVNKYINQAKKDSLSIDELLALDDPVLAHRMVGGNAAYSDSRFDELKTMLPYFASELKRPHVTMQLLWEEYRKESIRPYGITQFKEHLNRYIAGTTDKTASTILKDLYVGGEKAFLDFAGGKMQYVDVDTGEIHSVEQLRLPGMEQVLLVRVRAGLLQLWAIRHVCLALRCATSMCLSSSRRLRTIESRVLSLSFFRSLPTLICLSSTTLV